MSPSHSRRPPQELPEDIIASILFLLPPDDPRSIFRASRVCREWHRILTDPTFCRCYRKFHRTPPLLGYIKQEYGRGNTTMFLRFDPTTAFRPRRLGLPDGDLILLDARHGRVIFALHHRSDGFVIWDPVTGVQCRVPEPPSCHGIINSDVAVLCGADGCDHLHCHGGPSLVALVGVVRGNEGTAIACLYSTEAGAWSDTTSIEHGHGRDDDDEIIMLSRVLVSNALYFVRHWSLTILRYNLVSRELSVINWPEEKARDIILMTAEDGVLVCAHVQQYWLRLWSSRIIPNGALAWVRGRDIEIEPELPELALEYATPSVVGITDSGNVIFLRTFEATFTIELSSGELNEVYDCDSVIPYINFYTLDHANSIMPLP